MSVNRILSGRRGLWKFARVVACLPSSVNQPGTTVFYRWRGGRVEAVGSVVTFVTRRELSFCLFPVTFARPRSFIFRSLRTFIYSFEKSRHRFGEVKIILRFDIPLFLFFSLPDNPIGLTPSSPRDLRFLGRDYI